MRWTRIALRWSVFALLVVPGSAAAAKRKVPAPCTFPGFTTVFLDGRVQVQRGDGAGALISCDTVTGFAFSLDPAVTRGIRNPDRPDPQVYTDFVAAGATLAYRGEDGSLLVRKVSGGEPKVVTTGVSDWVLGRGGWVAWTDDDGRGGLKAIAPYKNVRTITRSPISGLAAAGEQKTVFWTDATGPHAVSLGKRFRPGAFSLTAVGKERTARRACRSEGATLLFARDRVRLVQTRRRLPVACDADTGRGTLLRPPGAPTSGKGNLPVTVWDARGSQLLYAPGNLSAGELVAVDVATGIARTLDASSGLRGGIGSAALQPSGTAAFTTMQTGGPGTFQSVYGYDASTTVRRLLADGSREVGKPDTSIEAPSVAVSRGPGTATAYWLTQSGVVQSAPVAQPYGVPRS